MIAIVEVSPVNEREAARELERRIAAAWPSVKSSPTDNVTIVVGIAALREIDLLVFIDLAEPRPVPSARRRDGTHALPEVVHAAVLAIEVKQHDATRCTIVGNQIFCSYADSQTPRSVNAQVADVTVALRNYAKPYGLAPTFFHSIGWLTGVPGENLHDVAPDIVGAHATWPEMLDAAAWRSRALYGLKSAAERQTIATLRETLTRVRPVSPRDRRRANALCNGVLARDVLDDLEALAGTKLVTLAGRGGCGKTTTLALLAKRLAESRGERVLILTFHKALRGDIEHLVRTLVDSSHTPGTKIVVETMLAFLEAAVMRLGGELPRDGAGGLDFARFDAALRETLAQTVPRDFETLQRDDPARFGFDYVFVDESQDCTDAERDFLRAAYGNERLVLADGLEQLVRRQTPCDWIAGVHKDRRHHRRLERSLRMTTNVANFANAVAAESGFSDWHVRPYEELPGGRVIIVEGGEPSSVALVAAMRAAVAAGEAAPVDALVCVPPTSATAPTTRIAILEALADAGEIVWNGCRAAVRDTHPVTTQAWRVVRYDSCRGLEGWVTLALGIDTLLAAKRKHPNLAPGDGDSPDDVARRWLMIALTRAVHTLVIGIDDPASPVTATFRAAAARLGNDAVEWTTASACAARLAPAILAR